MKMKMKNKNKNFKMSYYLAFFAGFKNLFI